MPGFLALGGSVLEGLSLSGRSSITTSRVVCRIFCANLSRTLMAGSLNMYACSHVSLALLRYAVVTPRFVNVSR